MILWDDTWVRYHEPGIGRSAVAVLEAAGYAVGLATGRKCCGRPAASRGLLDVVRRSAEHNVRLLEGSTEPILFLEPSCWSMFRDEYLQLGIEGAEDVAARCVLFEDFLGDLLDRDPDALPLTAEIGSVAVHGHCHAKALSDANRVVGLLERLPGASPRVARDRLLRDGRRLRHAHRPPGAFAPGGPTVGEADRGPAAWDEGRGLRDQLPPPDRRPHRRPSPSHRRAPCTKPRKPSQVPTDQPD